MRNLTKAFEEVKKADFIIHNTVHELELNTLSVLKEYQPNYPVGPVSFSKNLVVPTLPEGVLSESHCTNWLNNKPPNSVLYISFGTLVQTNRQVIEEIAYGVLLSEVNFIWVIRSNILSDGETHILPIGFEDAVKDKGLIVPWCDQKMVLSDRAVHGFLTHCGWNSITESIWCGVPMICYPLAFDQPTNRKLVVDDWKIRISLCDEQVVNRENVAKKIKSFMHESTSKGLKQEMKKVRAMLHNAVEVGGTSENNFKIFIKDLEAKVYTTTTNN